jgi:hypothetical protein
MRVCAWSELRKPNSRGTGGKRNNMKITIDTIGHKLVARDEVGTVLASRSDYCNPAALAQIICDAEMFGEIDWQASQVAAPEK